MVKDRKWLWMSSLYEDILKRYQCIAIQEFIKTPPLSHTCAYIHSHTHRMSGGNPELFKAMVDHGFLGN